MAETKKETEQAPASEVKKETTNKPAQAQASETKKETIHERNLAYVAMITKLADSSTKLNDKVKEKMLAELMQDWEHGLKLIKNDLDFYNKLNSAELAAKQADAALTSKYKLKRSERDRKCEKRKERHLLKFYKRHKKAANKKAIQTEETKILQQHGWTRIPSLLARLKNLFFRQKKEGAEKLIKNDS